MHLEIIYMNFLVHSKHSMDGNCYYHQLHFRGEKTEAFRQCGPRLLEKDQTGLQRCVRVTWTIFESDFGREELIS